MAAVFCQRDIREINRSTRHRTTFLLSPNLGRRGAVLVHRFEYGIARRHRQHHTLIKRSQFYVIVDRSSCLPFEQGETGKGRFKRLRNEARGSGKGPGLIDAEA